jgi:outer membrane usher protein FimD/PapC
LSVEWKKDVNSEKYGVGMAKTFDTIEISAQVEQQKYNNTNTKDTGFMLGIKQPL